MILILFHEKHLAEGGIHSPPPVFLSEYKDVWKQRSSTPDELLVEGVLLRVGAHKQINGGS